MNTCIFIGNLVREPELRVTQAGTSACMFTIAVNRPKDQNGESKADFIPIECYKKRAESCQKYLKKGSKVSVQGTLQTYSYKAKDGSVRYGFKVLVDNRGEITFLPSSQHNGSENQSSQADQYYTSGDTEVDCDDLPF